MTYRMRTLAMFFLESSLLLFLDRKVVGSNLASSKNGNGVKVIIGSIPAPYSGCDTKKNNKSSYEQNVEIIRNHSVLFEYAIEFDGTHYTYFPTWVESVWQRGVVFYL